MRDSDPDWEEVASLLHGTRAAGAIAAKALVDLSTEENLSKLMHELAVQKLQDASLGTRENAAYAIQLLCQEHAALIAQEFQYAKSDGELLLLEDIDIENILSKGLMLRGMGESTRGERREESGDIYDKRWVQTQRKLLRQRLGLEGNEDGPMASRYTEDYMTLVNEDDFSGLIRRERRKGEGGGGGGRREGRGDSLQLDAKRKGKERRGGRKEGREDRFSLSPHKPN